MDLVIATGMTLIAAVTIAAFFSLHQLAKLYRQAKCDLSKEGEEPHEWGPWEKTEGMHAISRQCNVCGWVESNRLK